MFSQWRWIVFQVWIAWPAFAAPTGVLRGQLFERGTRAPLVGIHVELPTLGQEAWSDAKGRFEFVNLPAGAVQIRIADDAYATLEDTVAVAAGQRVEIAWYLRPEGFAEDSVRVVARRPDGVVRRVLSVDEIDSIAGTNGDPLGAVTALPGVARTPFGQTDIILRGGGESRAVVNGQWIPLAFHFGGIRSVISGGLIDRLDMVPGNYGVEYGRGNGGLVEMRTRAPRDDRFGGRIRVDLFDAEVLFETPLTENSSLALAGRRSYIDAVLPAVLPEDSPFKTAPRYWDFQAIHAWKAGPHRVDTMLLGSHDAFALLFDEPVENDPAVRDGLDAQEGFVGVQSTWSYRLSESTDHQLMVGWLRYDSTTRLGEAVNLDLAFQTLTLRNRLTHQFSDAVTLRLGVDTEVIWGDFDVTAPVPENEGELSPPLSVADSRSTVVQPVFVWPAAWVEMPLKFGRLRMIPGLRVDAASQLETAEVQPRITAQYAFARQTIAKLGAGRYVESPDIDQTDPVFGNPNLGYEVGTQYSLGLEQRFTDALRIEVTGFYKQIDAIAVGVPDPQIKVRNQGEGRAYGAEVLLRHAAGARFHGWLAYTLMRAERRASSADNWRLFDRDQTHILNLVGQFRFNHDWSIGGRFRWVSGSPTTPFQGADFDSDADTFVPIAGGINSARLPAFHQLDLRLDRQWRFDTWMLITYLDVQNVYGQRNAEGVEYNFDYTQSQQAAGLPILPTFGLEGRF